jgi:hypothetical protein
VFWYLGPCDTYRSAMRTLTLLLVTSPLAWGHGSMVHPRSRNSVDWPEVKNDPSKGIHNTWSTCQNLTGAPCNNGQATYWYSQGW